MRIDELRVRVRPTAGAAIELPLPPSGVCDVGLARVVVDTGPNNTIMWSVQPHNNGTALDAVGLVWNAGNVGDSPPRMFVHGYQSWAPARTMRLGVDRDPTHDPRALALVHAAFHADPGVADDGELRSEQVTVLAIADKPLQCIGFLGGDRHAGTVRARIVEGQVEVCAEAWLGGAVLPSEATFALHDITLDEGDDASTLLEAWATQVGDAAQARVHAPFIVGWCSWYHYFERVTENAIRDNLARAQDWPFDVFQLDDGFQRAIGDWLATNERFPSGVDGVAHAISTSGATPGIWIAPFLAAPESELANKHPEWLARAPHGDGFAIGMYNDIWGGVMAALDVTQPEVIDHLETTAAALVDAGYRYLKLDFTFSAAMPGRYADASVTPAQRVRAGYDAVRRGAGDDVFILGCGAPLGAVVGVVDGMRIGADVAPWWDAPPDRGEQQPGYEATLPSTHNAFVNTCTRSFMHRKLWLNDPDCIMLRNVDTELTREEAERWARTVGESGGLVLVSDDLALLGGDERRLLDEVIELGRAADDAAAAGKPPRALGLLDTEGPASLERT
jgi:alpha-galactosidase